MTREAHRAPDAALVADGRGAAPLVSVIVVSYNTRDMTLECLDSIARETSTDHEVIVIDNASPDGSADAVAERFADVTLLAEQQNHGFAKANNLAARRATGRYLLLLNPDTVVLDGAIDRLVGFAQRRPEAGVWGGTTQFADGELNPSSCWRQMSLASILWRATSLDRRFPDSPIFNAEAYGGWERDSDRPVDIVSGCFLLIDRALWRALDGFDETYVMYGEEADLCLRAKVRGAEPAVTADARIVHHGGASETVRGHKHTRLLSAKITLARRYLPSRQRSLGVWLLRIWPLSRVILSGVSARLSRTPAARAVHESWLEVWRNRTQWWNGYVGTAPLPHGAANVADGASG